MAVGGCRWARPANAGPFLADVRQDYRAAGYEGDRPSSPARGDRALALPGRGRSFLPGGDERALPFHVVYSTEDYLDVLATQTGTCAWP